MTQGFRRTWRFVPLLGLLAIGPDSSVGQSAPQVVRPDGPAPVSLVDPRLEVLRRAATVWESRPGPERQVVDQVCLVPDLPTFLEAIATWDRGHWFPILFDDVESSFRFIRAFKPSRVIRFPRASSPIARAQLWDRAVAAVGRSWSVVGSIEQLPGDVPPRTLGPSPPGVVVSGPGAPMLAGAVALAAGRFQPMIRLDHDLRYSEVFTPDQFAIFDRDLTAAIRRKVPAYPVLGDDCDFLTIAGDWPYRVRDARGELIAVDDAVGRSLTSGHRWAFAGRLLGDPALSVDRAMSSLFLQPDSALLFNGYDEASAPWSEYAMRTASAWLSRVLPASQVSGEKAGGLDGWHETFDPINKHGLILINSHGSPTVFHLRGGPAGVADLPRGVPSVVLMIHSFSAADPLDRSTVAGRWLANGAYVYFGSMNEPYLQSFRTPRLVADLLVERLPVVSVVRSMMSEPYGRPWRLTYLGDPLYRLIPKSRLKPRLALWEPTVSWPVYTEPPRPADGLDADLFFWTLKAAIARMKGSAADEPQPDLAEALLGVRRNGLPEPYRLSFDSLLIEILLQARRRAALRARIAAIPAADRSEPNRRAYENLLAVEFSLTIAGGDPSKVQAIWSDLIRLEAPRELKAQATARVGKLADTPNRRQSWANLLRETLRDRPPIADADLIEVELKRVEGEK